MHLLSGEQILSMFKFNKINNFNYNESENSLYLGIGEEKEGNTPKWPVITAR